MHFQSTSFECILQIRANEINFWDKYDFEKMKDHHDHDLYPPRVKMTVITEAGQTVIFPLRFEGCASDSLLDADLVITSSG